MHSTRKKSPPPLPIPAIDPELQLQSMIDHYSHDIALQARKALEILQRRLPGATRMVYDNYNALVVGFGPNARASEAIFSVALYPRWVTLFFLQGAHLPDTAHILKGEGKVVRHIVLASIDLLDDPNVIALMNAALAEHPEMTTGTESPLIIKSISAKQRPRRAH
jgi:hypothetical protein